MTFLHMMLLMKFPFLPTGVLFISSLFGGSVANANAPRVSMIMLTQSNCTAVRGALPSSTISRRTVRNNLQNKQIGKFKDLHYYKNTISDCSKYYCKHKGVIMVFSNTDENFISAYILFSFVKRKKTFSKYLSSMPRRSLQ